MVPYCREEEERSGGRGDRGIGGDMWAGLSINGIIQENLPCHVLIVFGGHLSSNICPGLLDYLLME